MARKDFSALTLPRNDLKLFKKGADKRGTTVQEYLRMLVTKDLKESEGIQV